MDPLFLPSILEGVLGFWGVLEVLGVTLPPLRKERALVGGSVLGAININYHNFLIQFEEGVRATDWKFLQSRAQIKTVSKSMF